MEQKRSIFFFTFFLISSKKKNSSLHFLSHSLSPFPPLPNVFNVTLKNGARSLSFSCLMKTRGRNPLGQIPFFSLVRKRSRIIKKLK